MMTTALLCAIAGCGEPPVSWPESSPFPTRSIHLGMTHAALHRAHTDLYVNEEGRIERALPDGWMHYRFAPAPNGVPEPGSRLIYVDVEERETNLQRAEARWDALVAGLAADLGVEATCAVLQYGRLTLRRATLRTGDSPLAAAVDIHIETAAPGSDTVGVTTRMWLPAHASLDGARLPGDAVSAWLPCDD